jgi:hypothetical protein
MTIRSLGSRLCVPVIVFFLTLTPTVATVHAAENVARLARWPCCRGRTASRNA